MRDHRMTWPAFLVGCHRTGTTLARYLLDAHPSLACPPESKFIAGLAEFLDYPQALPGLRSLGTTRPDMVRELGALTQRVFDRYARRRGKTRWIDKTPNYFRQLPFIDELMDHQVLFLFIVRHPLDTIDSLQDVSAFAQDAPEDPEALAIVRRHGHGRAAWAHYWRDVYQTVDDFRQMHADRCHTFRYEDLVRSPEETVRGVLAFLDEPWSDGLLERAFTKRNGIGYEDWKIQDTRSVHRRSLRKWSRWPAKDVRAAWKVVAGTATRFGYKAPPLVNRPSARRSPRKRVRR